jgi:DNA-binding NarL/FixJ family response regulator
VIRAVVAASSTITRAGLEALVNASGRARVAASVSDWASLAPAIDEQHPDAILAVLETADQELPSELLQIALNTPVVLMASDPAPAWLPDAIRQGVRGILRRDAPPAEILAALEAAANGLIALPADMVQELIPAHSLTQAPAPGDEPLTPRELEILRMLADGLPNKMIAARLDISEHTVKFHVASIMGKLRAQSRTEAVTAGLRRGLILL